jgi:hypothetical protein
MRRRLATRGNTSVMNLQTFPGDFLFKLGLIWDRLTQPRPLPQRSYMPVNKAGCTAQVGKKTPNTKSAGGISIPPP